MSIIGLVFIASALAITIQPELIDQIPQVGNIASTTLIAIFILIFGFYGMKSFRVTSIDDSMLSLQIDEKPEIAKDSREDLKLELNWKTEKEARKELRKTTKEVLKRQKGYKTSETEEIVHSGDWTNDKVAAAFIDTNIKYPLIERLREWLEEDETLERRANRTLNAVEKLHMEEEK